MGLHRRHGHEPVPDRKGRDREDHLPQNAQGKEPEAHDSARADRNRGRERRRHDHTLVLTAALRAVCSRIQLQRGRRGEIQLSFRQEQDQHHTQHRPARDRRDQHGQSRPSGRGGQCAAPLPQTRQAVRRRTDADDRRPAAARARSQGRRMAAAQRILRHPVLLLQPCAPAERILHRRAGDRLPPERRPLPRPAQPHTRQPLRHRDA